MVDAAVIITEVIDEGFDQLSLYVGYTRSLLHTFHFQQSFSKATSVDVEELTHLNNAFQEWSAHFARQKK